MPFNAPFYLLTSKKCHASCAVTESVAVTVTGAETVAVTVTVTVTVAGAETVTEAVTVTVCRGRGRGRVRIVLVIPIQALFPHNHTPKAIRPIYIIGIYWARGAAQEPLWPTPPPSQSRKPHNLSIIPTITPDCRSLLVCFSRPNDFECPKDTKKTKICNAYQKIRNRGFEGAIQAH